MQNHVASSAECELFFHRHLNGIQLVNQKYLANPPTTVSDILNMPCNVYFLDKSSVLRSMNVATVMHCGFESVSDAVGRSILDVADKATAAYLINNDRLVIQRQHALFTDDSYSGVLSESNHTAITIKYPWYDTSNKVIGVFGCSIVIGKQSLSDSLKKLSQHSLLNSTYSIPGLQINNNYLTQRETEIAKLLVKGKSAKQIGAILIRSTRTIEHHLENMKRKMHVSSKPDLIEILLSQRYISNTI